MKKAAALLLALVLTLSLAACGGGNASTNNDASAQSAEAPSGGDTPAEPENSEPDVQYYSIGETVSTDIFEFTLDTAELAIALNNLKKDTDGLILDTYLMPKEYSAENDKNNPYVAPKGHTFVSITYTLNNLDRASAQFNDKMDKLFTIEYNDTQYTPDITDGLYRIYAEKKSMSSSGSIYSIEPNIWHEFSNYPYWVLLSVGEKETRRFYVDIPTDVNSLTDTFSFLVRVPNSDGTNTEFAYLINP